MTCLVTKSIKERVIKLMEFKDYAYFKDFFIRNEKLRISQSPELQKLSKKNRELFYNKSLEKIPQETVFNHSLNILEKEYNKFHNLDYDFKIVTEFFSDNHVMSNDNNIIFSNPNNFIIEMHSNININIYSSNNKNFRIALLMDDFSYADRQERSFIMSFNGSTNQELKKSAIVESFLINDMKKDLLDNNHFLLSKDFYDNINYLISFLNLNKIKNDKHLSIKTLKDHVFNFKDMKTSIDLISLNEDFIVPTGIVNKEIITPKNI